MDVALRLEELEARIVEQSVQQDQFLNLLLHNIRGSLMNIGQLSDMAIDIASDDCNADLKQVLEMQATLSNRTVRLTESLAAYANLRGDDLLEPISLAEAARAALDMLAPVIEKRRAEITIRDLPTVNGGTAKLTRLFHELITNALIYNQSERPRVIIAADPTTSGGVTVQDNGIGIPEKFLSQIFLPLERLWGPDRYEGSGLGLAICQKIAELHGGDIRCSSVEGTGSTFHIRFPAARA